MRQGDIKIEVRVDIRLEGGRGRCERADKKKFPPGPDRSGSETRVGCIRRRWFRVIRGCECGLTVDINDRINEGMY